MVIGSIIPSDLYTDEIQRNSRITGSEKGD
jgi:hypothetical protein